jgi:hypothetical protein
MASNHEPKNKTRNDAWMRLLSSRTGSFKGATLPYLQGLREYVHAWLQDIEEEIGIFEQQQVEQEEDEDCYCDSVCLDCDDRDNPNKCSLCSIVKKPPSALRTK